ncbi:DUF1656 domain-containing protein [Kushneria sp. TE3]|uniref:DUF1656 domain-containing protein n=1 Tax=Kushneria sp. TE3 TaxID=3449832 RepID=UPI003F6821C3
MLDEWSFLGFLTPPLFVPVLVALLLFWGVRRVMSHFGLYRFLWQPVLADIAIFTLLLWAVLILSGALPAGGQT